MSEVASLSLSKELYKLTGWKDTDGEWIKPRSGNIQAWNSTQVSDYAGTQDKVLNIPTYDLGYLIRKLYLKPDIKYPNTFSIIREDHGNDKYWATYEIAGNLREAVCAKTPEDACIKLLLILFKERL